MQRDASNRNPKPSNKGMAYQEIQSLETKRPKHIQTQTDAEREGGRKRGREREERGREEREREEGRRRRDFALQECPFARQIDQVKPLFWILIDVRHLEYCIKSPPVCGRVESYVGGTGMRMYVGGEGQAASARMRRKHVI